MKFLSRGGGYSLFLTGDEAVLSLRKSNSNGKRQMAKGKNEFQRSPFDRPRLLLERPASFQFPVSNFQTPATNNEPRTTDALLRMKLAGANPYPKIVGMDELPGKSNYFIGNDPKKWRTNVPNYAKVKYANVYPGVDLVYYGNQGQLEYDFVVSPRADPAAITLELQTDQSRIQNLKSKIDKNGDLVVGTEGGEVIFHKPVVYQPATYNELRTTNGGGRDLVEGQYVLRGDNRITFQLADYDRRRPLVIDPVLAYSTYLGGTGGDDASGIAVDTSGNAYVTGFTASSDFPTASGGFQTTFHGGEHDAFVSKLNAAGSALLYSTYLGGSGDDLGRAIAVDSSGIAYVTGQTFSSDFPTTPGAFQTALRGGSNCFISELSAAGSALLYSTYLGGSGTYTFDGPSGIAVDVSGNAYVTGFTEASDFPTTPGAFQTTYGGVSDAFVSKLNATGSALVYSTYLGGSNIDEADGIALDALDNAYVTGFTGSSDFPTTPGAFETTYAGHGEAFVTKLNTTGSALLYSTYLGAMGGSGFFEGGNGIAVDASGNAYATGGTSSSNFPTTPGAFQTTYGGGASDGFVSKLNAAGSTLLYSTFLGGSGTYNGGLGIAVDSAGDGYVTGLTSSSDFPTTPGAFQTSFGGGGFDAFFTKLNAAGSALVYSSYLGGSGPEDSTIAETGAIAVDAAGNAYITGGTGSSNFPVTPGAFQTTYGGNLTAFVARISPADAPGIALAPGSLSFGPQPVATTSVPQKVTLLAAGSQPLSITSIVATGDFAQTNTCGSAVPSGTTCRISVTFTPATTGTRTGAVTITDNAAGSPHQLRLTGTGSSQPAVVLAPASVTFPLLRTVGTSSLPQTVKLTKVGSGPLDITGITLTGPDPGDFVHSNNCPPTVASGASCLITVKFTPTAQGVRTASVSITDTAIGSPQTVPLTGRGTFLEWAPRSMYMGNLPVGTSSAPRTVKVTNAGSAPITLFSIDIGGVNAGDFTQSNTCGSSLKAGASCTIEVTFTPAALGDRLGHVAIRDSAFGGTHWVGLLGKGT